MTFLRFRFWVNNQIIPVSPAGRPGLPVGLLWELGASWLREQWAQFFPVLAVEVSDVQDLQTVGSITVGTTNICNAKCVFCAYPQAVKNGTLRTGVMTLATFQKVVSEWAKNGGKAMDLTPVVGDPLIDPGLMEKIQFARGAGISHIDFTTNGILLNHQDNYKKLVDLKVSTIHISIGATDEAMYLRDLRGGSVSKSHRRHPQSAGLQPANGASRFTSISGSGTPSAPARF